MLGGLGLNETEEATYRCLLGRPSGTAAELAVALGYPAREVAADLAELASRGLVAQSAGDPERYVPAPPKLALGALLEERRRELRLAEQALTELAEQHRAALERRTVSDLIEVVTGEEAVRQRFLQVQHSASSRVRSFVTAPDMVVSYEENTAEPVLRTRGIGYRVVIERAMLAEPGRMEDAVRSISEGAEIRVAEALPIKMVVADDNLALVPLMSEPDTNEPGAVVLHESGLLAGLIALFEKEWASAYPLRVGPSGDLTEDLKPVLETTDVRVLSLLLAGSTDQSIAAQLGLSERTVQRRIRQLMEVAGVRTRIQLGWHAARHDWA